MSNATNISRRKLLKRAVAGAAIAAVVPSSVLGADAPSERITIGCIGLGRMGRGDLGDVMSVPGVQIVAVCDVDSNRMADARAYVEKRSGAKGCSMHGDFRDVIARADIDAVQIVTPDHWHMIACLHAARAGKDIFVQKPFSLTLKGGRILADTLERYGNILQVGSQQRSDARFRFACELVRNGRIGKLKSVKVGFGTDPGCGPEPIMPIPEQLNYDMWLGPAPWMPYTLKRVHPLKGLGRPGWLRISDYGAGMITGWGSHHMDIAHWGMGMEHSGPVEIKGEAVFPTDGLWDVHGAFSIDYVYPNGVPLNCADTGKNKQGVLFQGETGWVYVRRGFIDTEPKSLLRDTIGPSELHLYKSSNHKANWIECIKSRKAPVAPHENGHRSCSACLLGDIAMRTGRKLKWDPQEEQFIGDDDANRMLVRPMRAPWRF